MKIHHRANRNYLLFIYYYIETRLYGYKYDPQKVLEFVNKASKKKILKTSVSYKLAAENFLQFENIIIEEYLKNNFNEYDQKREGSIRLIESNADYEKMRRKNNMRENYLLLMHNFIELKLLGREIDSQNIIFFVNRTYKKRIHLNSLVFKLANNNFKQLENIFIEDYLKNITIDSHSEIDNKVILDYKKIGSTENKKELLKETKKEKIDEQKTTEKRGEIVDDIVTESKVSKQKKEGALEETKKVKIDEQKSTEKRGEIVDENAPELTEFENAKYGEIDERYLTMFPSEEFAFFNGIPFYKNTDNLTVFFVNTNGGETKNKETTMRIQSKNAVLEKAFLNTQPDALALELKELGIKEDLLGPRYIHYGGKAILCDDGLDSKKRKELSQKKNRIWITREGKLGTGEFSSISKNKKGVIIESIMQLKGVNEEDAIALIIETLQSWSYPILQMRTRAPFNFITLEKLSENILFRVIEKEELEFYKSLDDDYFLLKKEMSGDVLLGNSEVMASLIEEGNEEIKKLTLRFKKLGYKEIPTIRTFLSSAFGEAVCEANIFILNYNKNIEKSKIEFIKEKLDLSYSQLNLIN